MLELPRDRKVLFFCAHPDDDTFSSGATIYEMTKRGNEVICIFLTTSPRGVLRDIPEGEKRNTRKMEGTKACRVVGAKPVFLDLDNPRLEHNKENVDRVTALLREEKPDIVFNHPKNDAHPTHKKTSEIVLDALRAVDVNEVWFYETWTPLEKPNFIFFFGEGLMNIKKQAMEKHETQTEKANIAEACIGLNLYRGIMGKELLGGYAKDYAKEKKYGEAFLIEKR